MPPSVLAFGLNLASGNAGAGSAYVPDETAPVVSLVSGDPTGTTTATLYATTDEAGGRIYWYVSESDIPPATPNFLISGAGAVFSGYTSVSIAGQQTKSATGLDPATAYFLHALHRDPSNNDSDIESSLEFETDAVLLSFATLAHRFVDGATDLPNFIEWSKVEGGWSPIDSILLDAGVDEHVIPNLDWNTQYTIRNYEESGDNVGWQEGEDSAISEALIWTAPELPPGLSAASAGDSSITLTITPPASPPASQNAGSGYAIERWNSDLLVWEEIQIVPADIQLLDAYGDAVLDSLLNPVLP